MCSFKRYHYNISSSSCKSSRFIWGRGRLATTQCGLINTISDQKHVISKDFIDTRLFFGHHYCIYQISPIKKIDNCATRLVWWLSVEYMQSDILFALDQTRMLLRQNDYNKFGEANRGYSMVLFSQFFFTEYFQSMLCGSTSWFNNS